MNSTPNNALHVEALEPPLHIRRQFLSDKYVIKQNAINPLHLQKISSLNQYDLTNKYWKKKPSPPMCISFRECNSLLNNSEKISVHDYKYWDLLTELRTIIPVYSENLLISTNILRNILSKFINPTLIYTDASKSEEGNGCAFFISLEGKEFKFKLQQNFSVFTLEAIAIYEALKYLEGKNLNEIVILSDSFSVINSIKHTYPISHKVNPYILRIKHIAYNIIKSGKNICFVWVKAHIGLKDNEHVDILAKQASINGILLDHKIPPTDNYNVCKTRVKRMWQEEWQQICLSIPSKYCKIQPVIPHAFWFDKFKVSRKYVTTLIRLRFGHACYPAHLYKIGVLQSQYCEMCDKIGDLDHIFFECKKHNNATTKLIHCLTTTCNVMAPFNVMNVLCLCTKNIYDIIFDFLEEIKIRM